MHYTPPDVSQLPQKLSNLDSLEDFPSLSKQEKRQEASCHELVASGDQSKLAVKSPTEAVVGVVRNAVNRVC